MKNKGDSEAPAVYHRWKLALIITSLSVGVIVLVVILAIIHAEDKGAAAQSVLTAVLPLLAAWVGTVIAYYYSSESMEAATKSVKDLMSAEEKLKTIFVRDKMIRIHDMVYFTYTDELKVQEMLDKLKTTGKGLRLPFLDDKKQPKFILHKSKIDEAMVKLALKDVPIKELTLKDLFNKVEGLKDFADRSFGVVAENATLADAKAEMDRNIDALDVFVTIDGRKDGTVAGWITNMIIEQSSRVQG